MANQRGPGGDTPIIYQIRVKGHLGRQWADRFEELTITLEEDGITLLTGPVVDQAALFGILRRIRDLGIVLISVNSVRTSLQVPSESKKESDHPTNPSFTTNNSTSGDA